MITTHLESRVHLVGYSVINDKTAFQRLPKRAICDKNRANIKFEKYPKKILRSFHFA